MTAAFPGDTPDPSGLIEATLGRLIEATQLVALVEDQNLLAELPPGDDARRNHQRACSLLAILHRELDAIALELSAALETHEVLSRTRPRRTTRPG